VVRRLRLLPLPLVLGWGLVNGCAVKDVRLGDVVDGGAFAPTEAGAETTTVLMCVSTECPPPYATCDTPGHPMYTCGTDLSRDPENCGTCGNVCGTFEPIHMTSRCVTGACEYECLNERLPNKTDWRNCNVAIDDGCEVDVLVDRNNCGSCGNVCPPGKSCNGGRCGCLPNEIECPFVGTTRCVDPETDDNNCGYCGRGCNSAGPDGACKAPKNAHYGCVGGMCDQLKCNDQTVDCNGDLGSLGCAGDGCEVGTIKDRDNCGGCGIRCRVGEECIVPVGSSAGMVCAVPCSATDLTFCPLRNDCVDLLTDVRACGRCEHSCPVGGPNQVRSCNKGICVLDCAPGFGDCNQDASDGCETDLNVNPNHCGACGQACDLAAGQPCIEGRCLVAPCGAPGTQ
jgi:hypothetical protein